MILSCFSCRDTAILLIASLGLLGCAGSTRLSEIPLQTTYAASRHGLLHYKVPVGWFDATSDSQTVASEIWLVKNDYAATISVNEIIIDTDTRRAISGEGLIRLTNLLLSLSGANGPPTMLNSPETFLLYEKTLCSYTMLKPNSNDTVRVVILPVGERVFEVVALNSGKERRVSSRAVFSAQQSFLKGLRQ